MTTADGCGIDGGDGWWRERIKLDTIGRKGLKVTLQNTTSRRIMRK